MSEKRFNSLEGNKASGYCILWGKKSFIPALGKYESFKKGSLKIPKQGVPLYLQHDPKKPLANSKSGTLKFSETEKGLFFEAELPQSAKLEKELVARGDLAGSSLSFVCQKENLSGGHREIESALIDELSLVCRPAHEGTEVTLRNQNIKRKKRKWGRTLFLYPV